MTSLGEHWEAEAARWIALVRREGRPPALEETDFNFPRFLRVLPPPASGRALEIGCGEGRTTHALRAGGYDVEGIDVSETMIAAAQRADPSGRYNAADAAALPFEDETFALVVAFMALHHMDDLAGVVAEAARVLQPGGRFCFAVPHPYRTAGESYFEQHEYVVRGESEDGPFELWSIHRPLEVFQAALAGAGLAVEELAEPRPFADAAPEEERWRGEPFALHVRAAKN